MAIIFSNLTFIVSFNSNKHACPRKVLRSLQICIFSSVPIANIECYQDLIEAVSHRFPRISFVKFLYTNFQRDLIQDIICGFNKPTLRGQECWQSFQQDQGLTPRSSGCWSPWRTEIWKVNALMSWSPFIATFPLFGTKQANQWEPSLCLCDLFDLYQTPAACQTMNGSWRKKRKMKTNIFCHFIWKR